MAKNTGKKETRSKGTKDGVDRSLDMTIFVYSHLGVKGNGEL